MVTVCAVHGVRRGAVRRRHRRALAVLHWCVPRRWRRRQRGVVHAPLLVLWEHARWAHWKILHGRVHAGARRPVL